ncbi:MAG: transcription-repair coupling factor [Bacilli bacterium]|nr:transcription-repair coupling factor [Bacilli bacterium]
MNNFSMEELKKINLNSDATLFCNNDELFSLCLSKKKEENFKGIIVCSTLYDANKLYSSLSNFMDDVLFFPMDDFITDEAIATSPDLLYSRLDTLNDLIISDNKIVVTNLVGALRYLPTKKTYMKSIIKKKLSDEIMIDGFCEKLLSIGYKRESIVTKTGEYAVRGFIIDVFPIGEKHPIRLELFGNIIESIRYFDEENQRSLGKVDSFNIYPCTDTIFDDEIFISLKHKYLKEKSSAVQSIIDYFDKGTIIFKDYSQILINYNQLVNEMFEYNKLKDKDFSSDYMFSLDQLLKNNIVYYETINNKTNDLEGSFYSLDGQNIPLFYEDLDSIKKYVNDKLNKFKTIIFCVKKHRVDYLKKTFGKKVVLIETFEEIVDGSINIINKDLSKGFEFGEYVFISENELYFNSNIDRKVKYNSNLKYTSKINDYTKLNVGDYVVHNVHGIGIYNGMKVLQKGKLLKDYLEILYYGKDKLYIPVEKIDLIFKFNGNEGIVPKINKLSGNDWEKTKLRVRNKVRDIAQKLLNLYSKRELEKGYSFSEDTDWQKQFEDNFEYEATRDQLKAIEEIKRDMENIRPMDRLLCGDVGYGKTEVALRAIFKAVMDSKQVLYLCPTTILSDQQYKSAINRFSNFPISISLLNRFSTPREVKKTLDGLKDGTIDVVFGTHRLLSDDIKPKNLGLLVIDEEQRFGVVHKEKLKEYKNNVDVLTLTATPIPRTLQMSMVGIRNLSLIETPPVDRFPIQTYVIEENDLLIKDSIYKEMSRNGQIFLLYNKVESIEKKASDIKKLVPDAKIVVAHGQLTKLELEKRMMSFINHEYDIMICTTIIETGIDIPNVNTLIILDADRFGLSQLYQIRGRVGRSNKIAYAYLMYQKNKVLSEVAIKRLSAIKEFTELGSGFAIASRDLAIRGAGDILGSEQAGFIDTVGVDLYIRILNEEVEKLKGNLVEDEEEDINSNPIVDVSTHISDVYVKDDDIKIEIHRLINSIDSYEQLQKVKDEINDRFGRIEEGSDIEIYMYQEWFEKLAKKYEIFNFKETSTQISFAFSSTMSKKIDVEKLFVESFKISHYINFSQINDRIVISFDQRKIERHYIYLLVEILNKVVLIG